MSPHPSPSAGRRFGQLSINSAPYLKHYRMLVTHSRDAADANKLTSDGDSALGDWTPPGYCHLDTTDGDPSGPDLFRESDSASVQSKVRQKVRDLLDFIQDDDRLREERKKAKKNKDKYIGMSAEGSGLRNYSDRYEEEPHNNYNNTATRKSRLDEIDEWNTGKKSVAEEAIGKVKDLINKARGFDEPPDYGNDDDLFDEDVFPSNFKKSEYKDAEIGDFSPSDFKTEKSGPSRKARSPIKKIDLGAAATYRSDATDAKSQSDKSSVVSDVSLTKKQQPLDLLGGSTSPAGDANADFADFNPRQFESNSNNRVSGDFGDFSQFGSGSKSPASQTEFADFANFDSASQASPVAKTPTSPDFGEFTSVPAADTSAMSNADLLSMPVLQPVSPPATQGTGILDMPNITQPVMGQQPIGMTMCMPQAPMAGVTGMPSVMGAGSVNVGVGVNMAMGRPQMSVSSTPSLINGSSQLSAAPSLTPTKLPLVSSTAVSTSVVSNSSSVTVSSSVTSTKTLPSKWANAGVDISLDNLSPASKFQRSAAPTINQLQSASGQPQVMPMAQPMPVGQPMPMAQPVGVVPAIPVAQPGAPMQTGAGVVGGMMTGAQPGVAGLTTNMAQMNINVQGIGMQPAVASQGMMTAPAMPTGMGIQAMSGVPQQSMATNTFQQRANQAFTGLGTLSK